MSTEQLIAVITAAASLFAGFGKLVTWCVGKWMADREKERAERREDRREDRAATMAVATAMTTMSMKFDSFEKSLERVEDEVTGNHDIPRQTPPKGVRLPSRGYADER